MKKTTNLFEMFADFQLENVEAKNIKGGKSGDDMNSSQGIGRGGGEVPPFG